MRYTVFYLIEARKALEESVNSNDDSDLPHLLLDPVMLSHEESDSHWTVHDHAHLVKLLFLAQVKEYEPLRDDNAIEDLFGSTELSQELFDRWWTIRRLQLDDNADTLVPLLKQFAHHVSPVESELVNNWLDREIRHPDAS